MQLTALEVCWYWDPFSLQSRSELEQQSIEAASTSDAVTFITYVQSLKRKMKAWEKQVNLPNTIFLSVTYAHSGEYCDYRYESSSKQGLCTSSG